MELRRGGGGQPLKILSKALYMRQPFHLFFRHSKTSSSSLSADLSITCTLPSIAGRLFPISLVRMVVFVLLVMVAVLLVKLLALSPLVIMTSFLTRPLL